MKNNMKRYRKSVKAIARITGQSPDEVAQMFNRCFSNPIPDMISNLNRAECCCQQYNVPPVARVKLIQRAVKYAYALGNFQKYLIPVTELLVIQAVFQRGDMPYMSLSQAIIFWQQNHFHGAVI